MNRNSSLVKIYQAESKVALFICLLVTPVVAFTNSTASLGLIMVHALSFTVSIPVCSTVLIWIIPQPSKYKLLSLIGTRIAAVAVATAIALPLISLFSAVPLRLLSSRPLLAALISVVSAYTILALTQTLQQEREAALRGQVAQSQAAWQALTTQIRPHFLFNCLNGLEQLVTSAPERAQTNIRNLATMYRAVLEASEKKAVPLQHELTLVKDYLQLQQMRYADRLQYSVSVPKSLQLTPFPATLLLSMVENAVKHGIEKRAEGGQIGISAIEKNQQLVVTVTNPVPRKATAQHPSRGYGTKDIQQRLSLLFDQSATYQLHIENHTAKATVLIPLEKPS